MTTKPKGFTLTMDRVLAAPPERVFRAWTTPREVERWIAPNPDMPTTAELDVREGGSYTITMGPYVVRGRYTEIAPNEKLAFTWKWDGAEDPREMLVTITFERRPDGGTNMRLHHENLPTTEQRDNHATGWTGSFARLEEHLAAAE